MLPMEAVVVVTRWWKWLYSPVGAMLLSIVFYSSFTDAKDTGLEKLLEKPCEAIVNGSQGQITVESEINLRLSTKWGTEPRQVIFALLEAFGPKKSTVTPHLFLKPAESTERYPTITITNDQAERVDVGFYIEEANHFRIMNSPNPMLDLPLVRSKLTRGLAVDSPSFLYVTVKHRDGLTRNFENRIRVDRNAQNRTDKVSLVDLTHDALKALGINIDFDIQLEELVKTVARRTSLDVHYGNMYYSKKVGFMAVDQVSGIIPGNNPHGSQLIHLPYLMTETEIESVYLNTAVGVQASDWVEQIKTHLNAVQTLKSKAQHVTDYAALVTK